MSNKIYFDSIINQIKNQPLFVQESKIRKFLSKEPNCIEAWKLLIQYSINNINNKEAVRLSRMALNFFKNDHSFLNYHIDLLLNMGHFNEARHHIQHELAIHHPTLDRELDILEIDFLLQPDRSKLYFEKYIAKYPNNIRVIAGKKSAQSLKSNNHLKICFLLISDWHWTIQKSIIDGLDELDSPYYITSKIWALKLIDPAIVVISDASQMVTNWIRLHLPKSIIINTRHGLGTGGKNYGLYAAAATDYICVSSESVKRDLCKDALIDESQVWVTGFSQMDNLFQNLSSEIPQTEKKRVTFAPTFDFELSAIPVIGDNPIYWIRRHNKKIHITIRPHPHLFHYAPNLMNKWRNQVKNESNAEFDEKPFSDISNTLINTDLLISDVSSIALQFMTTQKPIISVIDLQKAKLSSKYAPEELEWKMHSATVLVHEKEKLHQAVKSALLDPQNPEILSEKKRINQYLFGNMTDGKSGMRIAMHLLSLVKKDLHNHH